MTRVEVTLLLALVFVLGSCEGESKVRQDLEAKLKQVEEEIGNLKRENENLDRTYREEKTRIDSKIKVSEELLNKGTEENKVQHKVLENLVRQLLKTEFELEELKDAPHNVEKMKLEFEIIDESITILKNRRAKHLTQKCFDLEKMTKNGNTSEPISGNQPRSIVDDTIVLQDLLRQRNTELTQLKYTNSELRAKLESLRELFEQKNKDLNIVIEQNVQNHLEGKQSIDKVKKELEEKTKELEVLFKSGGESKTDLDKWKMKVKNALIRYQRFAADIECFGKLYNEVFSMVFHKP